MIGLSVMLALGFRGHCPQMAPNEIRNRVPSRDFLSSMPGAGGAADRLPGGPSKRLLPTPRSMWTPANWWAHSNLGACNGEWHPRPARGCSRSSPDRAPVQSQRCRREQQSGNVHAEKRPRRARPSPILKLPCACGRIYQALISTLRQRLSNDRGREAGRAAHFEAGLRLRPPRSRKHTVEGLYCW